MSEQNEQISNKPWKISFAIFSVMFLVVLYGYYRVDGKLDGVKLENVKKTAQIETLEKAAVSIKTKNLELIQKNTDLVNRAIDSYGKITKYQKVIEDMRSQISDNEALSNTVVENSIEIDTLKSEKEGLEKRISSLNLNIDSLNRIVDMQEKQIALKDLDLKKKGAKILELTSGLRSVVKSLDASNLENKRLKNKRFVFGVGGLSGVDQYGNVRVGVGLFVGYRLN